jgi:hypothetical protein
MYRIPTLGLFVGVAGLSFQVLILNPWHDTISKQIKQLENRINTLDNTIKDKIR